MYMLFVFGREVERFIGRRAFIVLYVSLLLAPTVLLSLWGLSGRVGIAGSPALHFGIFIAFATIYPSVELLLRIQAKWVALASGGHFHPAVAGLPGLVGHGCALGQYRDGVLFHPAARSRSRTGLVEQLEVPLAAEAEVSGCPSLAAPRRVVEPENVHESIDPVLEKISKQGINSLTASERRALDRARTRLLKEPK